MADDRIAGAPPPRKKPRLAVIRVKSPEGKNFTLISECVFGQLIHYAGGRSHECSADSKKCNGCERGWPQSWKGYIHAQDWSNEMEECFVEITANAVEQLFKQLPPRTSLRGFMCSIKKTKGGAKGRYIINVLERRVAPEQLPQAKDPLEVLRFLWACKNQVFSESEK